MNKNSETDISQEMVEKALGLALHSACAITAGSEMTNNFFQNLYGDSLSDSELIEAIAEAQGNMFNDESWVLSWNGLNAVIAADFGLDNYPVFYKEYSSLEDLQADGIEFYLQKFINIDNPDKTHFVSWSNGIMDDPYATVQDKKWWEKQSEYKTVYYGFRSKY